MRIQQYYVVKLLYEVRYSISNSQDTIPAGSSASRTSKEVVDGLISIARPPTVGSVRIFVCKLSIVGSATLSGTAPLTITEIRI